MSRWLKDAAVTLRSLLRSPLFTAACVVSLGLGIAANTTVFSVLDALVLQPLPVEEPERVVLLWQSNLQDAEQLQDVSPANFLDWRRRSDAFAELAAYTGASVRLTSADQPEQLQAMQVSAGFFDVLGTSPLRGRTFRPQETATGRVAVAVLSRGLWQRRFGGDPEVLGRRIVLDGRAHTVVGVMPEGWYVAPGVDLWLPLGWPPDETPRDDHFLRVIGRLAPGVSLEQAAADMDSVAAALAREYPQANAGYGVGLRRATEVFPSPGDRRLLYVLSGIVVFVLLIACANVANLLLARATSRGSEMALRAAFGAGRWPLLRYLLVEGLLIGVGGALVGILLSLQGVRLVSAAFPAAALPGTEIVLNLRVLLFTSSVGLLTGLLCGLIPAWRSSRPDLRGVLVAAGRSASQSRSRHWLSRSLVSGQFAAALVLLTLAVLLIAGFVGLRDADPGFPPDHLVTFRLELPVWEYSDGQWSEEQQITAHLREIYQRLDALPGVEGVAATTILPRSLSDPKSPFQIVGRPEPLPGEAPIASWRAVSRDFFDVLGVPKVSGRSFRDTDRFGSPPVVVVNRALAERHFPEGGAVGESLQFFDAEREIVGVVESFFDTRAPRPSPTIYLPHHQSPRLGMSLVLRTSSNPEGVISSVPRAVWEVDRELPVTELRTFRDHLEREFAGLGVVVDLLSAFSILALVLAGVGLYGLMGYTTARRNREFGIRLALGAERRRVLVRVLREALLLCGVGLALGVALLLPAQRLIRRWLGDLVALDPVVLVGIVTVLVAVTLGAALAPARRATRVDPAITLRAE